MLTTGNLDVVDILRAVPESVQQRLLQIGEEIGAHRWEIGDIANWILARCEELGYTTTLKAVCVAVSAMCKGEIRAATVERYSLIAEFYPDPIRSEYEPLPWTLFEVARRLGDRWRMALDFCREYLTEYGRPPTRAVVEMRFADEIGEVVQDDMSHIPTIAPLEAPAPQRREDTPPDSPAPDMPVAVALAISAARQIVRVIPDLPLENERRQRLASLAQEIINELMRLDSAP